MADSTRQTIMDDVVSALGTISNLHVSETLVGWEEAEPKGSASIFAYPIDGDESRESMSLFGGGANDVKATFRLTVTCYCFRQDNDGAKLRKARTDLIRDIPAALEAHAGLAALLLDLRMPRVVTDSGVVEHYSIFDCELELDYLYTHTVGG